jgi:hypothetical protein
LWGERATSFPEDAIISAGEKEPQVAIFVGTLVRGYVSKYTNRSNSIFLPVLNNLAT